MFFAKVLNGPSSGSEKLAIFGTRRARRGAELKVMSAVEHKHPGYFLSSDGRLRDPLNQPARGAALIPCPPRPRPQRLRKGNSRRLGGSSAHTLLEPMEDPSRVVTSPCWG